MRALVISGPGRHALVEHEVLPAGSDDLTLEPLAVGLCATDLELLDGTMVSLRTGRTQLPLVPGHEWVARVLGRDEPRRRPGPAAALPSAQRPRSTPTSPPSSPTPVG